MIRDDTKRGEGGEGGKEQKSETRGEGRERGDEQLLN